MTDSPTATEGTVDLPNLFSISMPDADDQVWLCDEKGYRCQLLGRTADVAEALCQWLGAIDHGDGDDAVSEWQPIESAPKDGTPLLLIVDSEHELGSWETFQRGGGGWMNAICSEVGCSMHPTHWMPLPSPPTR